MDFIKNALENWETFTFLWLEWIPAVITLLIAISTWLSFVLGFVSRALQLALIVVVLTFLSQTWFFDMITDFLNWTTPPS